jgi:O-antigen ligase
MLLNKNLKISLSLFALLFIGSQLYSAHVHPFRTYYHELSSIGAVLVAFVPLIFTRNILLALPKTVLLMLGLLFCLGVQLALQLTSWSHIIFPGLYLLMAILAMILGASWVKQLDDPAPICLMLALSHLTAALLSVVMQNVQFLGFDWRPVVMFMTHDGVTPIRPFANVAQPNQLALLLCFGLASLWWLTQANKLKPVFSWCISLVLLWGLTLTQSRIAWIILPVFVGLILTGMIGSRRWHWVAVSSLLLIYAGMVLMLPIIGHAMHVVTGSLVDHVGGRSERTILAKHAWEIALQHPWLGAGWFGFGQEQVRIAADFTSTTYAEHAHNIVLNFAAELGFPITILFFSAIIIWIAKACIRKHAANDNAIGFALMFFIAVGVHSLVEFPMWYAYVLLPVALLAGMVQQVRFGSWAIAVPRWIAISLFGSSIVVVALINADYQRVTDGFVAIGKASAANPAKSEEITAPRWTTMPEFYDYFRLSGTVAKSGMSQEEQQFVERMSLRFGFAHVLNKLAEIDALNGKPEQAKRLMQTVQRLHPFAYPEYYDYWKTMASNEAEYQVVFETMPKRDAP